MDRPQFFKKPKTEIAYGDGGEVQSVFIRLREGKAAKTSRPNGECLVIFFWGEDGFPIGIQFLEPVEGIALFRLVCELEPEGVDMQMHGDFLTYKQLDALLHEMHKAAKKLPATSGSNC